MDTIHCIAEVTGGPFDGRQYLVEFVEQREGDIIQIREYRHRLELTHSPDGFPSWNLRYIGMGSKKA